MKKSYKQLSDELDMVCLEFAEIDAQVKYSRNQFQTNGKAPDYETYKNMHIRHSELYRKKIKLTNEIELRNLWSKKGVLRKENQLLDKTKGNTFESNFLACSQRVLDNETFAAISAEARKRMKQKQPVE